MNALPRLQTERLLLRPWCESDRIPFTALHADPQVMRFLPACLTWPQSEALAALLREQARVEGFGLWCLELPGEVGFIGLAGLRRCGLQTPYPGAMELVVRIAARHWGRGLASEAGQAVIDFAFEQLAQSRLLAACAPADERSRAFLQRLELQRLAGDFAHPALAEEHPLRRQYLFELSRERWLSGSAARLRLEPQSAAALSLAV